MKGQVGATLLEVLVAIFIMGVGLLALLTLFPVGALEMAQAVKDDRTAAIAAEAEALSKAGTELVSRTADFALASLAAGAADGAALAELRDEYEALAVQAADIEHQLLEVKALLPHRKIQPQLAKLLAQIRSIGARIEGMSKLLALVATVAID